MIRAIFHAGVSDGEQGKTVSIGHGVIMMCLSCRLTRRRSLSETIVLPKRFKGLNGA